MWKQEYVVGEKDVDFYRTILSNGNFRGSDAWKSEMRFTLFDRRNCIEGILESWSKEVSMDAYCSSVHRPIKKNARIPKREQTEQTEQSAKEEENSHGSSLCFQNVSL